MGFPPYSIFTLEEIEDATNNFDPSNLIGEGPQGQVKEFSYFVYCRKVKDPSSCNDIYSCFTQLYKGRLSDGSMVMVNCVKLKQKSLSKTNVHQNLKVFPYLRHRHLVSVLGHCAISYQDRPQMTSTIFIVFEHISSNVSLRDHLTGKH